MSNQLIAKPLLGTPLNRSHPLAANLKYCFLFNEGGGDRFYNATDNSGGKEYFGQLFGGSWVGGNLSFAGVNTQYGKVSLWPGYLPLTVSVKVMFRDATTQQNIIDAVSNTSGENAWFMTMLSNNIRVYGYKSNAASSVNSTSGFVAAYTWYEITGVFEPTNITLYVNGRKEINNVAAGLTDTDAAAFSIGSRCPVTDWSGAKQSALNGLIERVSIWQDILTPRQVADYYADPYAMFRPSMPYWFWSSETATITGTLGGSLQRISGDLDGTITVVGTISGSLDRLTSSLIGVYGKNDIELSGSLDRLTGSFTGVCQVNAALAGALGRLTGDFSGLITVTGTLSGSLDRLSGSLRGQYGTYGRHKLYIEIGIDL